MVTEKLFDLWGKKNPAFEKHFKETLIKQYTEYGGGSAESMFNNGKIFGAGYEIYIYAFFLGLYANKRRELSDERDKLGQPIEYWGNLETRKGRKGYPKLREYMFVSLIPEIADGDLIALEKGEIQIKKIVRYLIDVMEEYANYGFYQIKNKTTEKDNPFYRPTGFLDFILDTNKSSDKQEEIIEDL
ncbi:MAG: hypothetical protein OXC03_04390 [Flavobacteriaceae bacterium]|nr:hypothetical protein [Flavobacteriaceae bacterium]